MGKAKGFVINFECDLARKVLEKNRRTEPEIYTLDYGGNELNVMCIEELFFCLERTDINCN